MDNINLMRVGFLAPEFKILDTDGEIDDPVRRSNDTYSCLVFINPDDIGAKLISELEQDLPNISSGLKLSLSVIVPAKLKPAKRFKDEAGFISRLFCDSDLRIGRQFSIIDSSLARPSYHPMIFIIGNDNNVRYRQVLDPKIFDIKKFRASVSELI